MTDSASTLSWPATKLQLATLLRTPMREGPSPARRYNRLLDHLTTLQVRVLRDFRQHAEAMTLAQQVYALEKSSLGEEELHLRVLALLEA